MEYSGALTREQFMFQEMRITSRLKLEGMDDQSILERVYDDNLFQYPTEREIKSKCRACLKRLASINDMPYVLDALANGTLGEAKQAALVALMCQSMLMQDFMVTVIGEKFRRLDMTLTRRDMNLFFERLAEQSEVVASWSDQTIKKLKVVIRSCLREAEYIHGTEENLYPVLLGEEFVAALKEAGYRRFLPAFNVFD
jgi:hypothetical protein